MLEEARIANSTMHENKIPPHILAYIVYKNNRQQPSPVAVMYPFIEAHFPQFEAFAAACDRHEKDFPRKLIRTQVSVNFDPYTPKDRVTKQNPQLWHVGKEKKVKFENELASCLPNGTRHADLLRYMDSNNVELLEQLVTGRWGMRDTLGNKLPTTKEEVNEAKKLSSERKETSKKTRKGQRKTQPIYCAVEPQQALQGYAPMPQYPGQMNYGPPMQQFPQKQLDEGYRVINYQMAPPAPSMMNHQNMIPFPQPENFPAPNQQFLNQPCYLPYPPTSQAVQQPTNFGFQNLSFSQSYPGRSQAHEGMNFNSSYPEHGQQLNKGFMQRGGLPTISQARQQHHNQTMAPNPASTSQMYPQYAMQAPQQELNASFVQKPVYQGFGQQPAYPQAPASYALNPTPTANDFNSAQDLQAGPCKPNERPKAVVMEATVINPAPSTMIQDHFKMKGSDSVRRSPEAFSPQMETVVPMTRSRPPTFKGPLYQNPKPVEEKPEKKPEMRGKDKENKIIQQKSMNEDVFEKEKTPDAGDAFLDEALDVDWDDIESEPEPEPEKPKREIRNKKSGKKVSIEKAKMSETANDVFGAAEASDYRMPSAVTVPASDSKARQSADDPKDDETSPNSHTVGNQFSISDLEMSDSDDEDDSEDPEGYDKTADSHTSGSEPTFFDLIGEMSDSDDEDA